METAEELSALTVRVPNETPETRGAWQIVGFAVLAAVVVGVIVNAKDIKRYIRISTM